MRYASIDIGTNTILMLIGEVIEDPARGKGEPRIKPLKDFYEIPRVGKNVSITKRLDPASIERALEVLRSYKAIADDYTVDKIIASATSAVRDAVNREDFIGRVKDDLGIEVEVISGEMEADIGFMGAISGSPHRNQPTLVIDIGGGSTELGYGTGMRPILAKSLDIGAVRITESFLHHDPPNPSELTEADESIRMDLSTFPFVKINPRVIFAVAGTATALALIAQKKYEFDASAVTNYVMSVEKLVEIFEGIKRKSTDEILGLTEAAKGRADVLVAGALILLKILEAANATEFVTTDRGLRYGYLLYKHKQLFGK